MVTRPLLVFTILSSIFIGIGLRDIFAGLSIAAVFISILALTKESLRWVFRPLPYLVVRILRVHNPTSTPADVHLEISNDGRGGASNVRCQWHICDSNKASRASSKGKYSEVKDWIPPEISVGYMIKGVPILAKQTYNLYVRLISDETGNLKEQRLIIR